MTLKGDVKFKEKLTCGFKYDMRNMVKFHLNTQKWFHKNFISMGSFCPKRFELKKYGGIIFLDTESDAKFE